jgi:hypothetical protein
VGASRWGACIVTWPDYGGVFCDLETDGPTDGRIAEHPTDAVALWAVRLPIHHASAAVAVAVATERAADLAGPVAFVALAAIVVPDDLPDVGAFDHAKQAGG